MDAAVIRDAVQPRPPDPGSTSAPAPPAARLDALVGIDLLRAADFPPPTTCPREHTAVQIPTPSSSTATSRAPSPALQPLPPDRSLPKPRRPPSVSLPYPNPNQDRSGTRPQNGIARAESLQLDAVEAARPPPAPRLEHSPNPSLGFHPYRNRASARTYLDTLRAYGRPRTYLYLARSLHPSLVALFLVSVSATLSNKTLLRGFFEGLTYSLTTWQLACASLGTMLAERIGVYRPQRVPTKHARLVQAVAFAFSCEILCSNLALRLVPVPVSLVSCLS